MQTLKNDPLYEGFPLADFSMVLLLSSKPQIGGLHGYFAGG
jgi:hypothetical protein